MSPSFNRVARLGLAGFILAGALGLGTTHAAGVSVTIDNKNGSSILSAPQGVYDLNPPIATALSGTASFDPGAEGGVILSLTQTPALGRPDLNNPTNAVNDITNPGEVLVFQDIATLTCDAGNVCTWKYSLPFGLTPGVYHVTATASEPANPDPITASKRVDLTII